MRTSKSMHTRGYDISIRVHIIVLYSLIACLTIGWALYFIYFSYTIRAHVNELNLIKKRLVDLEAAQITISSSVNIDDPLYRRLRHTRIPSKLSDKQQQEEESDALLGAIHFKVPVRKRKV